MGIHRKLGQILVAAAVMPALSVLAACATPTPVGAPAATTSGPPQVTLGTLPGGTGQYLIDGAGRALYLFQSDTPTRSACTGPCASAWPPLSGSATAGTGLTGPLTTIARPDGSKQAAYYGHPLDYFNNAVTTTDIRGEGLNTGGGLWYLVDPSGKAITTTTPPTSVGGMGGGY
jgi:predicted lipoprotein with Yx(FWY)xxD motif